MLIRIKIKGIFKLFLCINEKIKNDQVTLTGISSNQINV